MWLRTFAYCRLGSSLAFALIATIAVARADPLASWNDTATKQAIIDFVTTITQQGGPEFVPDDERVAVFDMDGTLIPEKPIPAAVIPLAADLKEAVVKKPILADKPAIAAFLKGDEAALYDAGEQGLNDLIATITDSRTTEEFSESILPLMKTTAHDRFHVPYTRAVYKPMTELLSYLDDNGFENWICSGSPVLFTRAVSMEMLGIPPERVMGTSSGTKLDERDGKTVLVFDGTIDHLNDQEGKPPTINLALGARPIFVGGNEGGRGDIAMMRWSKDRTGPSFQLLINHDDAEREFEYSEPDNYSLDAAKKYGFYIVSIKNDWKEIIAP
ncbi:HAD family hydrolase [Mesorhizobium sp. DCY119]|uniref:HAD family hydrolase n=1 Tax=Mesorhizobium sp. DCY119 TaxID=2108445 RepID=UPI000E7428C2|nr:HAD family hydrolase [Mesorhizobium sp. DCY119]RJG40367.1 haloacid dehalogenase-like hydrolase [Mesorhizobium sp. DCY119]